MEKLTKQEHSDYEDAFKVFDKDNDGTITVTELGDVMRKLNMNPTDAELQDLVNEVDADGNGDVDLPEFISLMARKMKVSDGEEELIEAFKIFDKNSNGVIGRQELHDVIQVLGEDATDEEVAMMMIIADPDGNDMISFDEFTNCYNKLLDENND